jgi:hypothetical protein
MKVRKVKQVLFGSQYFWGGRARGEGEEGLLW